MDKEVGTESEKKREKKMRTRGESNGGGRGPPPKSPFVTLGFQFPGKEQPPPPVLN